MIGRVEESTLQSVDKLFKYVIICYEYDYRYKNTSKRES